jgi:hypothetical protein
MSLAVANPTPRGRRGRTLHSQEPGGKYPGGMGYGKTNSRGPIEMLDAYPALILCPPHWSQVDREIEEVIPGRRRGSCAGLGRSGDERRT